MAIITHNNIESFINEIDSYLHSTQGRKFLDNDINGFGEKPFSIDSAKNAAEDLRKMIIAYAESEFTISQYSIYQHIHNIDISAPVDLGNGKYRIDLNLYGDLSRRSLSSKSSGAYDIVGLFVRGWDDKRGKIKNLFGIWRGNMVKARTIKDRMDFISDAVDLFNMKYRPIGIIAEIGDDYK